MFRVFISFCQVLTWIISTTQPMHGQVDKGTVMITGSAGISLIGLIFDVYDDVDNVNAFNTPVYNVTSDIGISKGLTIGPAVAFQTFGYKIPENYYNAGDESFKEKWTCINVGARILYHFTNKERINVFAGVRPGLTIWNFKSTYSGSDGSYSEPDVSLSTF